MTDPQELQLARSVDSALSVANSSISLIARGRKEAASLRHDHAASKIAAIRNQAEQGNAEAQFTLANELSFFISMETLRRSLSRRALVIEDSKFLPNPSLDEAETVHWYRLAAEQGHCEAQYELGSRYAEGKGVPKDDTEAVYWLSRAAEQDHLYAIVDLAYRYDEGIGVPSDHETAVRLCSRAVEIELPDIEEYGWDPEDHSVIGLAAHFGHAGAQNVLGEFYCHDFFDRKTDYEEAAKWFRRAAEQGYARAQLNLGRLYHDGDGVPQDDNEALHWARLAAEQGFATAQNILGAVYKNGEGLPQDDKEALRWYNLVAARMAKQDAVGEERSGLMADAVTDAEKRGAWNKAAGDKSETLTMLKQDALIKFANDSKLPMVGLSEADYNTLVSAFNRTKPVHPISGKRWKVGEAGGGAG